MSVNAISASPLMTGIGVSAGASKYTDIVNQYVNTLASGSQASLDDKLSAWQNLMNLVSADTPDGKDGLLNATNKNDALRASDALGNCDTTKQILQAYARFGSGLSPGNAGNGNFAQDKLDIPRSRQDPKILW